MIKKIFVLVATTVVALSVQAENFDIATVMGKPSEIVSNAIIAEHVLWQRDRQIDESSTFSYSILKRLGIEKAFSIEAMKNGAMGYSDFWRGLIVGASKARVVFTIIGPVLERLCAVLADYPDTAYVIVAGNDAMRLEPEANPSCLARNILRVAALDQNTNDLMSFANWGELVRIAAPASHIAVENIDGSPSFRTGTTMAASLVAGRLASFAKAHPDLKGAVLIDQFLAENSVVLPALLGKVEAGRALN
jgi:hypothetical protein